MTSLSRRFCILMVVCSLLAEGLLVEAKGGRGRSRGGYSYGGGGGNLPTWALILIIVFSAISIISILLKCVEDCAEDCESGYEDEAEDENLER